MFGEPVVTTLVRFFVCVRGCGCLLSTRLSLRPLSFEGHCLAKLGRYLRCEKADSYAWMFEN